MPLWLKLNVLLVFEKMSVDDGDVNENDCGRFVQWYLEVDFHHLEVCHLHNCPLKSPEKKETSSYLFVKHI